MKHTRNLSLGGIAFALILAIIACATPAQLIATQTPAPTNTPVSTNTPIPPNITIPAATPATPVTLYGCATTDCPSAYTLTDYLGDGLAQPGIQTTVKIPWTQPIHIYYNWCATDRNILDTNLKNINFIFSIDEVSYVQSLQGEYYDVKNYKNVSLVDSCYGVGGLASDWKLGDPHRVRLGLEITADINDGKKDFPGGTSLAYDYLVVPTDMPSEPPAHPTDTPEPTLVYIPPTSSGPAAPPVNAEPACLVNSNILIDNRSDGPATLYLTGPASFTFTLGLSANTVLVCSGTYNYYITGTCNGSDASGTGKISDGDNIYFYCN